MKYSSLLDKVVVITGASSGVGKLAVEEFLAQGAKVVLAARNDDAMRHHLQELAIKDDTAIAVKTDVSDYAQVKALARRAKDHFGRIDVWVNNASISLYGTVDLTNVDEMRRIIDVNLMGQIHGMKAALEVFKEQKYGNIVNIASALGKGSTPLQSAYVASKHGIVGFSSALREELMTRPYKDIDISVLLPSSMDTPLSTHARSKMGRMPKPIPPVYDPSITVKAIVQCAKNPRPEVAVGGGAKAMVWAYRYMPMLLEWYMGKTGIRNQLTDRPEAVEGEDNFFAPMPSETYQIRGGLGTTGQHLRDYARRHPILTTAVTLLPALLAFSLIRRQRLA